MNLSVTISEIDELIRSGHRDRASLLIKEIKFNSVPRQHLNSLANLARRTGQLNLAWKIMVPIIRPKIPLEKPATDSEKATYAITLLGLGALPEAFELLEAADPQCADVNLALAFFYMNSWDYSSAAQKLKMYLRDPEIIGYQQMIAKVNLAAAYVATANGKSALPLLEEILETTKKNSWLVLFRNSLEIRAQLAVQQSQWDEAENFLKQADQDSETRFYLDSFFVKKWRAIIGLMRQGPTAKTLSEISNVRQQAEINQQWETIRDCDYYKSVTTKDQKLALELYFGTPYLSYRKRLTEEGKGWLNTPTQYKWAVSGQSSGRVFDVVSGQEVNGPAKIKPETVLHKTLLALTSDFYRPFSIGHLHSMIFPKEYFNPDSSPGRVAFLIQRLRTWIKQNELPLIVKSENDGFKILATAPVELQVEKVSQVKKIVSADEPAAYLALIKKLKSEKKTQTLKASEISDLLGLSIRSVRYFLKWAVDKNKVQKIGNGRESKYKFR